MISDLWVYCYTKGHYEDSVKRLMVKLILIIIIMVIMILIIFVIIGHNLMYGGNYSRITHLFVVVFFFGL